MFKKLNCPSRLRQFKALGLHQTELPNVPSDLADEEAPQSRLPEACSIQQRNCEAETLRVFRLITAQVFGRLLEESQPDENAAFDDYPATAEVDQVKTFLNLGQPRPLFRYFFNSGVAHCEPWPGFPCPRRALRRVAPN